MHALRDQVAVVTGGGTGIGRAAAEALGRAGCRVALVGRRPEPLEETAEALRADSVDCLVLSADVGDAGSVRSIVDSVQQAWGRLDVLVNNAGLNVPRRAMQDVSVEDWDTVLQVNLTGTFLMTRAALPVMREQQSGTVINVSSIAGHRPSRLTGPAYNAAKAGVIAFTESVNFAERPHGIRACAICPGEVATPILDKRPSPPSAQARAAMLQSDDLGQTILFVASLPQRATVELLTIVPTDLGSFA